MTASSSSSAPVELFSTSILSNHKVRSRHERYLSILTVKKIPFVYHDLASDEEAKSRWRRKARDPQIPGLLVHNEWRGTFDEFEEAVEFGEVDLFLRIESHTTMEGAPVPTPTSEATTSQLVTPADANRQEDHRPNPRAPSHSVKLLDRLAQPRAPSMNNLAPALPFAPTGSGRRKEHDAESFLSSLGISDLNLTEEELNEILEDGKNAKLEEEESKAKGAEGGKIPASSSGERGNGKYPTGLGLGSSKPTVTRTYIPSAEAGFKPLRLARMGDGSQKASSSASPLRITPSARFNASHLSSKALAAEAQASISSRSFSTIKLREAVSKGDKLEDAIQLSRGASKTDKKENVVGREDLDDLMASLGLNDVKMSEEEAEAFLMDGVIPNGLDMHGDRLGRSGSVAERARNEAAARDLARKAKERGYGKEGSRPTSVASSISLPESAEESKVDEIANVEEKIDLADVPIELSNDKENPAAEANTETNGESQEDNSGNVESPSVEATPMQRTVDLPSTSSDIDTTKGKSSTSSVATLLKVEVQAPSDDLDPALETEIIKLKGSSVSEATQVEAHEVKTGDNNDTLGQAKDITEVESNEFEVTSSGTSQGLQNGNTEAEPLVSEPTPQEEQPLSPKKEASLPALPNSPPLDEAPPPPSKSLSPPLSPAAVSSSKPTSPTVETATLSPISIQTSPTNSRRQVGEDSLTPRRRAMDLTRSMSSNSSLSEATSPQSSSSRPSPSSPPLPNESLRSPISPKSPKSGTKKFFGIGRKKDRSKKDDQDSDGDQESSSISMSPPLPQSSSNRSQKTLSMILKEADEALNGGSDDEDGLGISHDNENAFALELDDVDEDDGIEVATRR